MDDLDLRQSLRPLARDILPPEIEQRNATVRSAFDRTGGILPSALKYALPPLQFVWYLSGSLSAANNVSAEIELPGPLRLVNLVGRVKTAPSGTCNLRLTANGGTVATVNIPIGQNRGRAAIPSNLAVRDAGDILRVDVVNAGSAVNATLIAAYTVME